MTQQSDFREALLDSSQPVPAGLIDGQGRAAGGRYSVYRNNVAVSLADALEAAYPAVAKLIGPDNFSMAAGMFLRRHPPKSPLMFHYGAEFPAFLAQLEPLESIGYLADVARLERALGASYHAADAPPFDPARLQSLSEDQLMASQLVFAPSMRLLRSPWPVLSVYRYTQTPGSPPPKPVAQDVLIARPDYDPTPYELPQGGADFITNLQDGAQFGAALERAGAGFDLGSTLSLLLHSAALTDVITP